MSDLKIQGEFEMDTTKGEQALARVESGARRMANTVQQAGDKAADAMGGIGDKADQSAKVTERATAAIATATKRAISEAQRAVVEAQGYSLKSADGLEALARLRGADVDAIQGQTKALRELRAQHEAMLSAQREAVGAALFEQQHEAARKLVRDAEYVRTWASALDLLEAKQRELAALPDFERERDAASQAKRRADATYALTQALDIQEAKERELAALPAFEREREAAAQARRRADATAALTQVLDQQEAMERKLAAQGSFLTSLEGQADAIGKTRSQLLELQAAQLGVSDKAAPMIARLREQEVQFSKSGVSAAQTAAALRQLPAQFSDIVVSLQAGQAPLTVFLQQGSQIKDSFGGAGEAVKAMAGYVSGLITPVTLLGAGVAALAVAYNMGSKEMDEYRRSIVLTGNAAGVTAGHLQDMASRIGQGAGTQREAAQALAVFVKEGKVATGNLESFARTAVEFSRVTGESVEDVAKNFSDLAKDPLTATLKLNESMNFLTESTFRQIKALHDQGSATEAADLAQKTYAQTLDSRKDEIIRNLGAIEKAWSAIKREAGHAMDAFLDIGRARTLETRLSKAQKALDDYTSTLPGRRTTETVAAVQAYGGEQGLRNEIAGLQELIENQRKSAEMERQRGEAVKASSWLAQEATKHESDLERQRRAVAEATAQYQESLKNDTLNQAQRNQLEREYLAIVTGITQAKDRKKSDGKSEQEKELEKQAKLLAELSGLSSDFYEQWDRLIAAFKRGALSSAQLTEEQGKLLAKQPAIKAANDAHAKSVKDAETAYRKFLDSIGKTEERYAGLADQQEAANASFGKSKTAIEELALAQARLALANEKDAGPWTPEHIAQMEKAVSQQERYVAALKAGDLKTINAHTDELLRNAQEQAKLYRDEYQLMGLTALERAKIVALRQVELKYAKELADIDKMSEKSPEDRAAKLAQRAKVEQAKRIEGEAAVSKVIQDDWTRTADQINQSLTDALMRGFESGKDFAQNFRDTLKNMFSTLVLRPVVSAILMPVAGALTGALSLAGGANAGQGGVLSTVGSIGSGYSLLSGLGGAFGGGLSGGFGGLLGSLGLSATGTTLAGALDAGVIALQAGNIAGGLGTLAGALGPIALGLAGLVSVFGGMDRSGTPHWGAASEYSNGVLTGGDAVFRRSGTAGTYSAQAQAGVDAVAKGVGDTLEAMARAFGKGGGYSVMTAYSDDSSDDPGFGSLRITRDGQKIRDWEDDRYSKWAPGIFADGEEGWKMYLAAIAKDMSEVTAARVLVPIKIVPAMIGAGTSIPEPNTASGEVAWVSGGSYAINDLRTYSGGVYSCVQAHTGRSAKPDVDSAYWLYKGPTDRMAPFDEYISTKARSTGSITYVLTPGFINGVNVYGAEGATYSIIVRDGSGGPVIASRSGDLYAQAVGFWELLFAPLPALDRIALGDIPISPSAQVTITISSPLGGPVAVGDIKVGDWRKLIGDADWGGIEYGAESQRKTYTYRKDNDDGTYTIVPRGSARNVTCNLVIDAEQAIYADAILGEIINTAVPFEASNLPRYGYLNTLGFVSGTIRASSWGTSSISLNIKGNI